MRFIAACSIPGLVAGVLAAKAIQPANACDCIVANPETAELAVVSVTPVDSDEPLPDAERNRWAGMLSATMGLSDDLWLAIESEGNTLVTLRFDPSAEEAP